MLVYAATANKHKLKEMSEILNPAGVKVSVHPNYSSLDIAETGVSFEENAIIKAMALCKLTDNYVIADDSGLIVDALNGAPGIYSARYAGSQASDEENNLLLLENMKNVSEYKRSAKFICVIALARGGKIIHLFRGECSGRIAHSARGRHGFGYDPIFIIHDGRSMAELHPVEKNRVSHRNAALVKLAAYIGEEVDSR